MHPKEEHRYVGVFVPTSEGLKLVFKERENFVDDAQQNVPVLIYRFASRLTYANAAHTGLILGAKSEHEVKIGDIIYVCYNRRETWQRFLCVRTFNPGVGLSRFEMPYFIPFTGAR